LSALEERGFVRFPLAGAARIADYLGDELFGLPSSGKTTLSPALRVKSDKNASPCSHRVIAVR